MSLTGALTSALSGIQASGAAAQIISGNVSNAQTKGYTKKSIDLSESTLGTSLGGVTIGGYSRASDNVLAATLNSATSSASYFSTQSGYLSQVQSILNSNGNPPALSSAVSNFQAAWTEYSASPSDTTLAKSVVTAGQNLASTLSSAATAVNTLQTNVENDLSTSVQTLNTDLTQVQSLNTQIATALSDNQPAVNLQDKRDNLVNQIAQYTNVTVLQRGEGAIALYTSSGTALLDGQAQTFSVGAGGATVVNAVGSDVTSTLTGGTLQAQTDFLSSSNSTGNGVGVITKLQSQLQNFANMFTNTASGSFANIYNSATTQTGEQGSSFFTATADSSGLPDLSTFQVNASLVNGTTSVKQAAASGISSAFNATNLAINSSTNTISSTFNATGLSTQNQTYGGIATAILSGFQQAANTVSSQSATAATQQTYYQSSLSSETGVNTDTELVNLTNWQNSYAASAHVISTIQSMMQVLNNLVQ